MLEKDNLSSLEQQTLSQVGPINESLGRLFGDLVPPIAENSIHWVSSKKANEIQAEVNNSSKTPAFTFKGQIYFVKEELQQRIKQTEKMPLPLSAPIFKTIFALAHEALHNGCHFGENGTAKNVANICWQAIYEDSINSADSEVPRATKNKFRKVNEILQKEGDNSRVRVLGTEITLGSREQPLYYFGGRMDEDLIDMMATMTILDMAKHKLHETPKDEENSLRTYWLINANNRMSFEPDYLISLATTLRSFLTPEMLKGKFGQAYFKGNFYEEFASSLNDKEMLYFSCHLTLGQTAEALQILMGKK